MTSIVWIGVALALVLVFAFRLPLAESYWHAIGKEEVFSPREVAIAGNVIFLLSAIFLAGGSCLMLRAFGRKKLDRD